MVYNEHIKAIIDEVRPQFDILGMYAFQGEGEPKEVTKAFIEAATAYLKVKQLTEEVFNSPLLELGEGSMLCFDGGTVGDNDEALINAYEFAKDAGFLPPPLLMQVAEFTFQMNRYFIAAQQQTPPEEA